MTSNDPAELLKSVKKTQRDTRELLRPGIFEVFVLLLAQAAGRLVAGNPGQDRIQIGLTVVATASISYALWARVRRRHNFGLSVSRVTWADAVGVFTATTFACLIIDGAALATTLLVIFGVGGLILGAYHRSAVLLAMGGVSLFGAIGDHASILSITGIALWSVAMAWFGRKQLFNR